MPAIEHTIAALRTEVVEAAVRELDQLPADQVVGDRARAGERAAGQPIGKPRGEPCGPCRAHRLGDQQPVVVMGVREVRVEERA